MIQHIQAEPVPPSRRASSPVPAPLDRLVLRCLAKQPADRPPTADDLLGELDRLALDHEWGQADARQWWATNLSAFESPAATGDSRVLAVR